MNKCVIEAERHYSMTNDDQNRIETVTFPAHRGSVSGMPDVYDSACITFRCIYQAALEFTRVSGLSHAAVCTEPA